MIVLEPKAIALRLCRVMGEELRQYDAITFQNPRQGIELYLRRCQAFGYLTTEDTDFVIDILDDSGSIIQDFNVTKSGFEYLRQKLKFKLDRSLLG